MKTNPPAHRKKQNKSNFKKWILVIFIIECIIIVSVCLGFVFRRTDSVVENVYETHQDYEAVKVSVAEAAEMDELNNLKREFVSIVKEKYPQVDLSFAIKNLDTEVQVIHNNKKMNCASIIKLFILGNVYDKLAKKEYVLTAEREKDLKLMITESNNQAANNFIDDFGGDNEKRKIEETNLINKYIKQKKYQYTELNRKMHDTTPPGGPSGYQNYTSVVAVSEFLEGIYNKTLFEEPYNSYTLDLLKAQKRRTKIPAKIVEKYPDVIVANKTGELAQVENDAAIIMGDDFNLAFVIMINDIPYKSDGSTDYNLKEQVQETISELALKLVDLYKNRE